MALKIKLARGGSKHNPHYSIVVSEAKSRRDGKFVEKVGHYHPTMPTGSSDRVVVHSDRVRYWVGVGAIPTEAVTNIVRRVETGLLDKFIIQHKDSPFKGMSKKEVAEKQKAEKAEAKKAKINNTDSNKQ
ncbi:MAG: 30S ribosomal protein S16 [Alphaproteobacteria bacterium]|nr:30S ribosomal protein S16 [Rickettsiales bacterium]